jgi:hypothetical protein
MAVCCPCQPVACINGSRSSRQSITWRRGTQWQPECMRALAERCASAAAESGSEERADAVGSRLQAVVMLPAGSARPIFSAKKSLSFRIIAAASDLVSSALQETASALARGLHVQFPHAESAFIDAVDEDAGLLQRTHAVPKPVGNDFGLLAQLLRPEPMLTRRFVSCSTR